MPFDDYRVATERKVRAVLLAGPDRNDESWIIASIALICAGLSCLTRSGPETGIEEGRVIASADSLNVRSGRPPRRAILAAAAIPLFLIAMWVRTPALPRTSGPVPPNGSERIAAAEGAIRALERALTETRERLEERAGRALDAPNDPEGAFAFLSARTPKEMESRLSSSITIGPSPGRAKCGSIRMHSAAR